MDAGEIKPRINRDTYDDATSEQIKAEIDQTRVRMDHALNEIGERLNPRHLFDEIFEYFRSDGKNVQKLKSAACQAGRSVVEQVQQHPLPCLLIGGGIAWWAIDQRRRSHQDFSSYAESDYLHDLDDDYSPVYTETGIAIETEFGDEDSASAKSGLKERMIEKGQRLKERITSGAKTAQAKAAHMAENVGQSTRQVRSQLRNKASNAYESIERGFTGASESYPLAVGLGFMTVGLLAGLLAPRTRAEDEMMGETAQQMRRTAKARGKELLDKGQRAATAAVQAAKEEAKAQGFTKAGLQEKASHIASDLKDAALGSASNEGLDKESIKEKAGQVFEEAKQAALAEVKSDTNAAQGESSWGKPCP